MSPDQGACSEMRQYSREVEVLGKTVLYSPEIKFSIPITEQILQYPSGCIPTYSIFNLPIELRPSSAKGERMVTYLLRKACESFTSNSN